MVDSADHASASDAAKMQAQLIELQTQLAFQEHTIAELSDAMTKQQALLDAMQREWAAMKSLYESLQSGNTTSAPMDATEVEERPPHY